MAKEKFGVAVDEESVREVDVPRGNLNPTLARLEEQGVVEHEPPDWSVADDDRVGAVGGNNVQYASI